MRADACTPNRAVACSSREREPVQAQPPRADPTSSKVACMQRCSTDARVLVVATTAAAPKACLQVACRDGSRLSSSACALRCHCSQQHAELPAWLPRAACRAFQDRCPHRLAPLSEGIIDASTGHLYCSYHGCESLPQLQCWHASTRQCHPKRLPYAVPVTMPAGAWLLAAPTKT